jgi:hypothetical protein
LRDSTTTLTPSEPAVASRRAARGDRRSSPRADGLAWLAGAALLLVALVLFAAAPGWTGQDLRALGAAESIAAWRSGGSGPALAWSGSDALARSWQVGGPGDGWLTGAWTCASRLAWSGLLGAADGGVGQRAGPVLGYRAEQIALLACAALCLSQLARRVLSPWFGRDHARAAGACAGLLLLAHPLAWMAGSGLEFRGPLLALCAELAALWVFLRARQERREGAWIGAALLAVVAGGAHVQACALPLLAALVEFCSARRYRTVLARARTAATTLAIGAACVGIEPLVRFLCMPHASAQPVRAWLSALAAPDVWIDTPGRFAWSLFPVNLAGASVVGALLAGALWLCALQPALLASRHAPRLWGGALLAAAVALAAGVLVIGRESASSDDLRRAWAHFAALPVAATTLGLGATALSGRARVLAAALCVALCAALAAADLRSQPGALREAGELGAALERARTLYGAEAQLVVIDPPRVHDGLPCSGDELGALLDLERGTMPRVAGPEAAAFLTWVRGGGFDARRREQALVALVRASALGRAGRDWQTLAFPARAHADGDAPIVWRGDGRSPDLAVDPLRYGRLRVEPLAPSAERSAALSWRAANESVGVGRLLLESDGASWNFDLSESLAWRLSGEVRRVWLEGPLVRMKEAVLEPEALHVLRGKRSGERLVISGPALPPNATISPEQRYAFALLDEERFELRHFRARGPLTEGTDVIVELGRAEIPRGASAWLTWRDDSGAVHRGRVELGP